VAEQITSKWESDSVLVFYVKDKEIARWQYKNDKVSSKKGQSINGLVKRYDLNGILRAKENYKNDLEDGVSNTYFVSGALESTQTYKEGLQDGLTTWFDENGKTETIDNYKDGELLETKDKTPEGTVNKTKYNYLEKILGWSKGLAYLYLVAGIGVGALLFVFTMQNNTLLGIVFCIISIFIGWILFVITLASIELIRVLIDIEANTSMLSKTKK
jgi:hypothetical protein